MHDLLWFCTGTIVDRCRCVIDLRYDILNLNVALLNSIFLNHLNLSSTAVGKCGFVMNSINNFLTLKGP